jgi:hypothetical protein
MQRFTEAGAPIGHQRHRHGGSYITCDADLFVHSQQWF